MKAVIRDRRQSAPTRIGCDYRLAALAANPGTDVLTWLPGDVIATSSRAN
jgi:hypothetical protein